MTDTNVASDELSSDALRVMLAEALERETAERDRQTATETVTDRIRETLESAASLTAGATAAGLAVPDLATILAAAITRAAPAAPETLAAVIAPDPEQTGDRRTRRSVPRTFANVPNGRIWTATLAGETGRVKITIGTDGKPQYVATTGARGTFTSASRAVQSACGNPAGAGRRGEATVNGYLALTLDGATLDSMTR